MSAAPSTGNQQPWNKAALLARCLLGGLFLYLGLGKVLHPAEFVRLVREQLAVANPGLSALIIITVPWLEVLYGLLLLSGIARNAAAVLGRWWLAGVGTGRARSPGHRARPGGYAGPGSPTGSAAPVSAGTRTDAGATRARYARARYARARYARARRTSAGCTARAGYTGPRAAGIQSRSGPAHLR